MLLRIRNRVLTLSAWCLFVFRHGATYIQNTYLPQHVTRKRILDFQGETWTDKQETERPNKNYARAPGWSNVQYQIRGYIVHPKDLVKVRAT